MRRQSPYSKLYLNSLLNRKPRTVARSARLRRDHSRNLLTGILAWVIPALVLWWLSTLEISKASLVW